MSKKKIYDGFALGFFETPWKVFNHAGKMIETRTSITPDSGAMMESFEPVVVDYPAYEQSTKHVLGNSVCCLTFAEHHSHASSVGHSNMVAIARFMVMDASDKDLEHMYTADSVASDCRVQGWFMDLSAVSVAMVNKYLDRHKWLSNGWPLANDHHLQVLAYRMATLRPTEVINILLAVGEHENLGEHKSLVEMRLRHTPPLILFKFTTKMLKGLESAVIISGPQELEEIDTDVIITHAARIAALYRETFLR